MEPVGLGTLALWKRVYVRCEKKRCVKPPLFQRLWGACKNGAWFCLFVSERLMKDSCMSPQRQKFRRRDHLQSCAEVCRALFAGLCICAWLCGGEHSGFVLGVILHSVSGTPPLLPPPMWVFSRKLGFLPQFIDKHVSLTGGSSVLCKGEVTKLFSFLSPTDCWERVQHQPMTQHWMDGVKDGWTGGQTDGWSSNLRTIWNRVQQLIGGNGETKRQEEDIKNPTGGKL